MTSSPRRKTSVFRRLSLCAAAIAVFLLMVPPGDADASVRPPENATTVAPPGGEIPGKPLGHVSDAEIWYSIRLGAPGTVSIGDAMSATLIQSPGEDWRLVRNGPLFDYMGYLMLATLVLLAAFFGFRGRIRVEHGFSGRKITRFSGFERMGHWLMAVSFIILGLSGLNVSFGREIILPVIGKDAFGPFSMFLKVTHHYVAFAFMLGLAIAFVTWVAQNIPNKYDLIWLSKAGGLFSRGAHPPARKFNGGQKIFFWATMLGGFSLCLSGWALLFPFEHSYFAGTFATFSAVGIDLPAMIGLPPPPYSAIQEQQFASIWHAVVAILMICMIFAHIYIGSLGMEGAFDAMGTGEVDVNWAKEHHSVWVEETMAAGSEGAGTRSTTTG